jgi:peroxiredoxin
VRGAPSTTSKPQAFFCVISADGPFSNRRAGTTASVVDTAPVDTFMPASFFLEGAGLSFG